MRSCGRSSAGFGEGAPSATPEQEERLIKAVMGLTAHEARKAFARALQERWRDRR
ncbi:MAG: hypothetical protein R3B90_23355 [Planctomycetaceae bacterium]